MTMHSALSLTERCGEIPGVASAFVQCDPALLWHLQQKSGGIPQALVGSPLRLAVRATAAPALLYKLWACWLPPSRNLQPALLPMTQWLQSLPASLRKQPMLLLARAEGSFATPPAWDLNLSSLLDERNPFHAPDGRVLLTVADVSSESQAALKELAKGLAVYLASLFPAGQSSSGPVTLPAGCMLLRSGNKELMLESELQARVYIGTRRGTRVPLAERFGVPHCDLPARVRQQLLLRGNLIWGSWRGDASARYYGVRFVASTSRPAGSLRGEVRLRNEIPPDSQSRFLESLASLAEKLQVAGGNERNLRPETEAKLIPSILRRLQTAAESDANLKRGLKTPYQLLHQVVSPTPLSMFTASELPAPPPLPDGDEPQRLPLFAPDASLVSLGSLLARDRQIQVLWPATSTPAARPVPPHASGFVSSSESSTQPERFADHPATNQRESSDAASLQIVHRIWNAVSGSAARATALETEGTSEVDAMSVALQFERPAPLLLLLLPEISQVLGLQWPLATEQQELLNTSSRIALRVNATLPANALEAWEAAARDARHSPTWLHAAASSMQRTLRAFLPLAALESEADCEPNAWPRALLVYRHAHPCRVKPVEGLVTDPRRDSKLVQAARSALPSLRRKAPSWQAMLRAAGVHHEPLLAADFAASYVEGCVNKSSQLRRLLIEEAALCNSLQRFADASVASLCRSGKARKTSTSIAAESAHFWRSLIRPARRQYPGGAASELLGLLLLTANATLASLSLPHGPSLELDVQLQARGAKGERLGPDLRLEHREGRAPRGDKQEDRDGPDSYTAGTTSAA